MLWLAGGTSWARGRGRETRALAGPWLRGLGGLQSTSSLPALTLPLPSLPLPAAGLSTHAAQRLVSLFHLLARRYNRLQAAAEGADVPPTPTADASALSPLTPWTPAGGPATAATATSQQQSGAEQQQQVQRQQTPEPPQAQQQQQQQQQQTPEQRELELQLYADFLRIVLEVGEGLDGCWRVVRWLVWVWEMGGRWLGWIGVVRGTGGEGFSPAWQQSASSHVSHSSSLPASRPACLLPVSLPSDQHRALAFCSLRYLCRRL